MGRGLRLRFDKIRPGEFRGEIMFGSIAGFDVIKQVLCQVNAFLCDPRVWTMRSVRSNGVTFGAGAGISLDYRAY